MESQLSPDEKILLLAIFIQFFHSIEIGRLNISLMLNYSIIKFFLKKLICGGTFQHYKLARLFANKFFQVIHTLIFQCVLGVSIRTKFQ